MTARTLTTFRDVWLGTFALSRRTLAASSCPPSRKQAERQKEIPMSLERIGNLREKFDPDRHFVTVKAFSCGGVVYGPGQPFGKGLVSPRRLRQLYDGRYLRHSEFTVPPAPPIQRKVK